MGRSLLHFHLCSMVHHLFGSKYSEEINALDANLLRLGFERFDIINAHPFFKTRKTISEEEQGKTRDIWVRKTLH